MALDVLLQRLRERYGSAGGGDIFDPRFRAVAKRIFTDGDRRKWPFSDPPTLLDAVARTAGSTAERLVDLDVALLGIPMDLGVTNRNGTRFGPRAVRAVERVGPYEHVLHCAPAGELRVADIGDVPMQSRFSLSRCHADIEAAFDIIRAAGVVPLSVGGDHSMTGSILAALGRGRPVGMIQIDAHCDTAGDYEGTPFHHGAPFRRAVLEGVLDPRRTVQIGIRGGAEYLWEFSYDSGMTVIHAEEVAEMGMAAVIAKARRIVGDGPTYVSFDIDSIDPSFAPGTGTPEIGGLTPREVLQLLRGLEGIDIVGGDVVEVAPQYDSGATTAHIGAQMLFQLLCLVARSPRFTAARTEKTA